MIDLLLKFWPYIVGALAFAFGAFKLRQSGAEAERDKQMRERQKARDIADEVDNDIGAMPPEARREALKKWAK